jgi:hypothetical protein
VLILDGPAEFLFQSRDEIDFETDLLVGIVFGAEEIGDAAFGIGAALEGLFVLC